MKPNEQVIQQLTRARTALIIDQPFFGMLALRLTLVADDSIPTLAVDGKHIIYNPEFVATLSPALTKSALAHETMHCVFDHIGRRAGRNPRKFNQAGDYVINAAIKEAGFEIDPKWLYNPAFASMSTDEIYNLLPDPPEDGKQPGEQGESLDEVQDGDTSSTESDATDWKVATVQAAASAKAVGKLPASMARFVEEITSPKIDWRAALRRFITETSKNDYSWMRPNRRFLNQGMIIPSLYSENMGELVVAIDTSGSITQEMLNAFGSEIKSIVQNVRPESTHVIYCDSAVNHVDKFGPNDELVFQMHGGGGTDFRGPFAHVAEHGLAPKCLVYLTDGYGPFPEHADYPVLWACTTDVIAPIGETIPLGI